MDKTSLAEWMLAQRFGVQRAKEIVGDLLEQHKSARAHWEMFRLALGLRSVSLLGLLLVSLLIHMAGTALYSPWQLRFMAIQRDLHPGWSWDRSANLAGASFLACLATAIAALRLGTHHGITRTGFAYSVTLPILSYLLLQQDLRWIAPVLLALVILWRLHSSGHAATLSFLTVAGAVACTQWLLFRLGHHGLVGLAELRSCLKNMHAGAVHPAWFTFYSSCIPLAIQDWFRLFASALVAYLLLPVLPIRNMSQPQPDKPTVILRDE